MEIYIEKGYLTRKMTLIKRRLWLAKTAPWKRPFIPIERKIQSRRWIKQKLRWNKYVSQPVRPAGWSLFWPAGDEIANKYLVLSYHWNMFLENYRPFSWTEFLKAEDFKKQLFKVVVHKHPILQKMIHGTKIVDFFSSPPSAIHI